MSENTPVSVDALLAIAVARVQQLQTTKPTTFEEIESIKEAIRDVAKGICLEMGIEQKKTRFITETDLVGGPMGTFQLIVIEPRYTDAKFVAVFGSSQDPFAEMVDSLTAGGSEWTRVGPLFDGTSWYPIGYGDTITEAIEAAIDRINTIDPKYKREALALVHNSYSQWNGRHSGVMTVPLTLTGEDW